MRLTKTRLVAGFGAVAALILTVVGFSLASSAQASTTTRNFLVTLYGWPDNSPPGNDIAYPKSDGNPTIHNAAGGTGTYSDPVTYATDKAELPVGTIVYYPYLHRYFIMEDDCTECDEDWTGHGPDGGPQLYHIDLWIGGQGGNSNAVINCEDDLTQNSEQVIIKPPKNEPVDTTPLFNASGNKCYNPSSFKGTTAPTSAPATSAPPKTHSASPSSAPGKGGGPSSSAPAGTAPAGASYTGIAGPGCANSTAASFVGVGFAGGGSDDWAVADGNDGTGSGCGDRFLAMPMSGSANTDGANRGLWVFHLPAGTHLCTLTVYVPKPASAAKDYQVDGTSALYGIFDGNSVGGAAPTGQFTVNQQAHRGGSVVQTGIKVTEPLLVVRLFDRGIDYTTTPNGMYGVGAVKAACS